MIQHPKEDLGGENLVFKRGKGDVSKSFLEVKNQLKDLEKDKKDLINSLDKVKSDLSVIQDDEEWY